MPAKLTPEQQKQQLKNWVAQWRSAEVALYEQKFLELQALTEEESARIANAIMWWTPELDFWLPIWKSDVNSGLIEQQRFF
jgi:hypothetical protein